MLLGIVGSTSLWSILLLIQFYLAISFIFFLGTFLSLCGCRKPIGIIFPAIRDLTKEQEKWRGHGSASPLSSRLCTTHCTGRTLKYSAQSVSSTRRMAPSCEMNVASHLCSESDSASVNPWPPISYSCSSRECCSNSSWPLQMGQSQFARILWWDLFIPVLPMRSISRRGSLKRRHWLVMVLL